MNTYVPIFRGLDARGGRKLRTDTHTHTQTHGTTTVTLAARMRAEGTLIGPPESLAAALHIVERDGPAVGLHLNRGKSLLHVPNDADVSTTSLPSDIPTSMVGFTLLGCPIGPPSYCEDVLQSRVNNIKDTLKVLCDMEESQLEMALLRSCLSFPKISYILRTCPPGHIPQATKDFDSAIRGSLEDIIGGPCSEWSGLKASLPSSRGGLNLREASLHAPAAFIASSAQFAELVGRMLGQPPRQSPHLAQALADLSSSASRPDWQQLEDIDVPIRQHHLSRAIDDVLHHQLTTAAPSTRARALALSTALPHAGDWLIGVFGSFRPTPPGQGVSCLPPILAWCSSTQLPVRVP